MTVPTTDRKSSLQACQLAEVRRDLVAVMEQVAALLNKLGGDGTEAHTAPTSYARSFEDEMVSVGWAAQYIKVSKDRLKDLAKRHGFGWLVGGRIKIHKGLFFEYILTHRPPEGRR